jgi:nitroreductase
MEFGDDMRGMLSSQEIRDHEGNVVVARNRPIGRDALEKLKDCTPYHFNAPMAILICYDTTVSWKRKYDNDDSGTVDASIVTTHMMLAAAELGLGTTWVGSFDPGKVRHSFRLPENYVPVAILPIGYPAVDAKPAPYHEKREPLENTVFTDTFPG